MTSGPLPSQSSPREAAPFQESAFTNATASFPAEPEANLPARSGPSNAQTSAEPSNAPAESATANPLAGAPTPLRLFETLVKAQIDNLTADVKALNSRMELMINRITALEASFNQLNVTRLARPADDREDNQSGGVQSSGIDPRAEIESELAWLAANPLPPAYAFPGERRGVRSGGLDPRAEMERELAWLAANPRLPESALRERRQGQRRR
ncbi:hypothetical protein KC349_g7231 [Hortaea werneckii]|nr:hypothetical protein KC349_g7231 [Hortaea werneckii]